MVRFQNLFGRGVLSLLCLFFLSAGLASGAFSQESGGLLEFSQVYSGASSLGLELSPKAQALNGKTISMQGFMAPPLKPSLRFFVLTKVPMSICPFCSSDADWPDNIVLVYLSKPARALPFDQQIKVTGRLELGNAMDEETGFISLVRIYANQMEALE